MSSAYVSSALGSFLAPAPRSQFLHDVRRRLFFTLPVTKRPRVRPLCMSDELRHVAPKRTASGKAERRLPPFEDAGVDVTREFVGDGGVLRDAKVVEWIRDEKLDPVAQELVELYKQLQDALEKGDGSGALQEEEPRVEHLGHGVYVQYNEYGLDGDSREGNPVTITHEESRSVVYHALDAVKERSKVCVTGQPGIGKTRGCMMHAIQALLHQGTAVLYVGYKSQRMLLFLPNKDGVYSVWKTKTSNFDHSFISDDTRVVAVIDPPEQGSYSAQAGCRVLMFASNNAKKHFDNWEKDGVLLVTSMPTKKEVIAMTSVLWDEKRTPHSWQIGKVKSMEEMLAEVEKRIDLVGPIPRFVFDSRLFLRAIDDCQGSAREAAERLSDLELYKSMLGEYTPFVAKHPASVTGKLFHLLPVPIHPKTWEERSDSARKPTLQLTAISECELRDRLEKSIEALRKESFEEFAFEWVCATEGRRPEIQYGDEEKITSKAYQRIASLRDCEQKVYRPTSEVFPMIDFATSYIKWFNAKSTKNDKAIEIGVDGARKFLRELQECIEEMGSSAYFKELVKHEAPALIVLKNRNVEVKLSEKVDLRFFDEKVQIKAIDLSDTSKSTSDCFKELSGYTRTEKLLKELEREQGQQSFRRAKL